MNGYYVIGADGKHYGPVSAEVLRQWISQGRANAQTQVRLDGTTDWKPLGELPDFAAELAAKTAGPPPLSPLPSTPGVADVLAAEILARGYELDIGRCISRGWDLVLKHFWLTVGATLLIHLIVGAVGAVPIVGLALTYVFMGGLEWMFLKLARGQQAELGDAFAGFNLAFGALALFSLVAQVLTFLGFLLCLVPGIYLAVCWFWFTPLLIIDKRLDFWQAMEVSRKVVNRHWWQVFGFALVCFLISLCGLLACGIGIFIALPIIKAASVYAYEDIFGPRAAASPFVPTAPTPDPAPIAPA